MGSLNWIIADNEEANVSSIFLIFLFLVGCDYKNNSFLDLINKPQFSNDLLSSKRGVGQEVTSIRFFSCSGKFEYPPPDSVEVKEYSGEISDDIVKEFQSWADISGSIPPMIDGVLLVIESKKLPKSGLFVMVGVDGNLYIKPASRSNSPKVIKNPNLDFIRWLGLDVSL